MNIDPQLEKLLDDELKKLPAVTAPPGLLRDVLAQLEARAAAPWWQRAWWQWPATAQAAFIILALALVAAVTTGGALLNDQAALWMQSLRTHASGFTSTWSILAPLGDAGLLLWEKVAQPLLLYGLVAAGVLYLACVGLGTMVFRVAWKTNSN